jgi:hypothetical protein
MSEKHHEQCPWAFADVGRRWSVCGCPPGWPKPMSDEGRARAREQLAAYAHEAWSGWMRYLFSLSTYPDSSGAKIPGELVERWLRQLNTPYIDLSEAEKDSDRAEADKMLDIVWAAARAEQAEARVAALEKALHAAIGIARHQARQGSVSVFNRVHPLTCGLNSQHAHLIPHWDGERLTLACIDCGYRQDYRAALSAPGQPEGTSEPSDFDALLEHHKATEAENALFKRALEYIVRRGYRGASFVADKALAGIDVTAALFAPGQPEGER